MLVVAESGEELEEVQQVLLTVLEEAPRDSINIFFLIAVNCGVFFAVAVKKTGFDPPLLQSLESFLILDNKAVVDALFIVFETDN